MMTTKFSVFMLFTLCLHATAHPLDNLAAKYGFSICNELTEKKLTTWKYQCEGTHCNSMDSQTPSMEFCSSNTNSFDDFYNCKYVNTSNRSTILGINGLVSEMQFEKIDPKANYGYGLLGSKLTYRQAFAIMKNANIHPSGKKTDEGYVLTSGFVDFCPGSDNSYVINFDKRGKATKLTIKTSPP